MPRVVVNTRRLNVKIVEHDNSAGLEKPKRKRGSTTKPPRTLQQVQEFISKYSVPPTSPDENSIDADRAALLQELFERLPIFEKIIDFSGLWRSCTWTNLKKFHALAAILPRETTRKLEQLHTFWEQLASIEADVKNDVGTAEKVSQLWPKYSLVDKQRIEDLLNHNHIFSTINAETREVLKMALFETPFRLPGMKFVLQEMTTLKYLWDQIKGACKRLDGCQWPDANGELTWRNTKLSDEQYINCFIFALLHNTKIRNLEGVKIETLEGRLKRAFKETASLETTVALNWPSTISRKVTIEDLGKDISAMPDITEHLLSATALAHGRESRKIQASDHLPFSLLLHDFFQSFFGRTLGQLYFDDDCNTIDDALKNVRLDPSRREHREFTLDQAEDATRLVDSITAEVNESPLFEQVGSIHEETVQVSRYSKSSNISREIREPENHKKPVSSAVVRPRLMSQQQQHTVEAECERNEQVSEVGAMVQEKNLECEIKDLQEQLQRQQRVQEQLRQQIQELNNQLLEQQRDQGQFEQEQKTRLNRLEGEKVELQEKLGRQQRKQVEDEQEKEQLQEQLQSQQRDYEHFKQEQNILREQLERENKGLEEQCRQRQHEYERRELERREQEQFNKKQSEANQDEKDQLEQHKNDLEQQLQQHRRDRDQREQEEKALHEQLERENENLQDQLRKVQKDLLKKIEMQEHTLQGRSELDQVERDKEVVREQRLELKKEIERLEADLKAQAKAVEKYFAALTHETRAFEQSMDNNGVNLPAQTFITTAEQKHQELQLYHDTLVKQQFVLDSQLDDIYIKLARIQSQNALLPGPEQNSQAAMNPIVFEYQEQCLEPRKEMAAEGRPAETRNGLDKAPEETRTARNTVTEELRNNLWRKALDEREQDLKQRQDKLSEREKEHDTRKKEFYQRKRELDEEMNTVQQQEDDLQSRKANLQHGIIFISKQEKRRILESEQQEKNIKELNNIINEQKMELHSLQEEKNNLTQQINDLVIMLDKQSKARQADFQKQRNLEIELRDQDLLGQNLIAEQNDLKVQLEQQEVFVRNHIREKEEQRHIYEKEIGELRALVERLEKLMGEEHKQQIESQAVLEREQSLREESQAQVTQLQQALKEAQEQRQAAQQKADQAEVSAQVLHGEVNKTKMSLEAAEERAQALNRELGDTQRSGDVLQDELKKLQIILNDEINARQIVEHQVRQMKARRVAEQQVELAQEADDEAAKPIEVVEGVVKQSKEDPEQAQRSEEAAEEKMKQLEEDIQKARGSAEAAELLAHQAQATAQLLEENLRQALIQVQAAELWAQQEAQNAQALDKELNKAQESAEAAAHRAQQADLRAQYSDEESNKTRRAAEAAQNELNKLQVTLNDEVNVRQFVEKQLQQLQAEQHVRLSQEAYEEAHRSVKAAEEKVKQLEEDLQEERTLAEKPCDEVQGLGQSNRCKRVRGTRQFC